MCVGGGEKETDNYGKFIIIIKCLFFFFLSESVPVTHSLCKRAARIGAPGGGGEVEMVGRGGEIQTGATTSLRAQRIIPCIAKPSHTASVPV